MLPDPTHTHAQIRSALKARLNFASLLKLLPGLCLLLTMAGGFVAVLTTPSALQMPKNANWLNGEAAAQFEANLNENLPLRDAFISTWGALEYGFFKQGREGVLVGQDNWLYTSEEFAHYDNEVEAVGDKLEYVLAVQRQLAERGIALVVTLVPAKARIYPEHLGRYEFPSYAAKRYESLTKMFVEAGLNVVDLNKPLSQAKSQGQLYFKTDTHWTPLGARVAAQALADAVTERSFGFGEGRFETTFSEAELEGDLMRYLPLGLLSSSGPQLETFNEGVTVQTDVGLFADTRASITLVGTSYSGDARWNFSGALKEALGVNIWNAAQVGRGEIAPMREYLNSEAFENDPPELLIWQFSERGFPAAVAEAEDDVPSEE